MKTVSSHFGTLDSSIDMYYAEDEKTGDSIKSVFILTTYSYVIGPVRNLFIIDWMTGISSAHDIYEDMAGNSHLITKSVESFVIE